MTNHNEYSCIDCGGKTNDAYIYCPWCGIRQKWYGEEKR